MIYIKLISSLILILFFSCDEKDTIEGSQGYKEFSVDSTGQIIHTDILIDDFIPAQSCSSTDCHPNHYAQWKESFHAKSFDDPIFRSIWSNEIDHRPSTGVMYCVQCHAPAAYVTGYNFPEGVQDADDINNFDLPAIIKEGVSCDICHSMTKQSKTVHTSDAVAAIAEYFLNPGEGIKYGSIQEPIHNNYHESEYLPLFNVSNACMPCHNQSIRGMPIETTISEWESDFGLAMAGPSCQACHMPKNGQGESSHHFAGVDLLFYDGVDEQSEQYIEVQNLLKEAATINFEYYNPEINETLKISYSDGQLSVPIIISSQTGHNLPSGTTFSRELWLELLVFDEEDNILESIGVYDNNQEIDYSDEDIMLYTSVMYDENNLITYEASNAYSYNDRTLKTLSYDTRLYLINIGSQVASQELKIRAKLLFRPFKPQILSYLQHSFVDNIPILEIYRDSSYINIP